MNTSNQYVYYSTLPFSTKPGWELTQTQYFTFDDITYKIIYEWNDTGEFYTAKILTKNTQDVIFNGKLTLLNLRLYAKDPITKNILFTLVPLVVDYGNVNLIVVW